MADERFPFVAVYSAREAGGAAWIDVLGGYADGIGATWQHLPEARIIELRFATDEQRTRFIERIATIEHVRPACLHQE